MDFSAISTGFQSRSRVSTIAVHPSNGNIYVGGYFRVDVNGMQTYSNLAYFDGTSWRGFSQQIDGSVYALVFGLNGMLYVGGNFTSFGMFLFSERKK